MVDGLAAITQGWSPFSPYQQLLAFGWVPGPPVDSVDRWNLEVDDGDLPWVMPVTIIHRGAIKKNTKFSKKLIILPF